MTLQVAPARLAPASTLGPGRPGLEEVSEPERDDTIEGQFQNRCRELIAQIRVLGFNPNVGVRMINSSGAIEAAKNLLADDHVLVATPWLIQRGRAELTFELEIRQPRWATLFNDQDRAKAAARLLSNGGAPTE